MIRRLTPSPSLHFFRYISAGYHRLSGPVAGEARACHFIIFSSPHSNVDDSFFFPPLRKEPVVCFLRGAPVSTSCNFLKRFWNSTKLIVFDVHAIGFDYPLFFCLRAMIPVNQRITRFNSSYNFPALRVRISFRGPSLLSSHFCFIEEGILRAEYASSGRKAWGLRRNQIEPSSEIFSQIPFPEMPLDCTFLNPFRRQISNSPDGDSFVLPLP